VLFDLERIPAGAQFLADIERQIRECEVLVAVIGSGIVDRLRVEPRVSTLGTIE
jgi:hypothetical protein